MIPVGDIYTYAFPGPGVEMRKRYFEACVDRLPGTKAKGTVQS